MKPIPVQPGHAAAVVRTHRHSPRALLAAAVAVIRDLEADNLEKADRMLLDRLVSNERARQVSDAIAYLERYSRPRRELTREIADRLVRSMLSARFLAEAVPHLPAVKRRERLENRTLRGCAKRLAAHFEEMTSPPSQRRRKRAASVRLFDKQVVVLMRSLAWAREVLTSHGRQELPAVFARWPETRKSKADTAPHVVFIATLSASVSDIFGAPVDDAVALLATVALNATDGFSMEAVRSIRRRHPTGH